MQRKQPLECRERVGLVQRLVVADPEHAREAHRDPALVTRAPLNAFEAELEDQARPGKMELNDLGVVRFRLAEPLAVDPYAQNRATGAFILIDEGTNDTIGAGMVVDAA